MDITLEWMKVPSFGELETADCALCGCATWSLVTRQQAFGENFQIVRCDECGLIRTNPRPTVEWKSHFYDPNYNGYAEMQGRDFIYAPDESRRPGYRRLLKLLESLAPRGSKLLDVGCAAGMFVREACDHQFLAEGCDYSDKAVAYGKNNFNVRIICSPAEAIDAPDNSYDVVTLLHVFEHLPSPMAVLKELRRILKPGGLLLLETVNYLPHYHIERHLPFLIPIYNALTKRSALPWVPFDHLYHWSAKTLASAMRQSEFQDVKLHHLAGYRSEQKPNRSFSVAYAASELFTRTLSLLTLGQCDMWPVLLATGRK